MAPKAKTAPKPAAPVVTGIRLPDELRVALDAEVAAENERLSATGASTSRQALVVVLLREALTARAKTATRGKAAEIFDGARGKADDAEANRAAAQMFGGRSTTVTLPSGERGAKGEAP